jgi:type II secretory pathway pseudopilin PulG
MKKWLKIIIALGIIGIIAAGLGYKFVYNKPHKNYEKAEPEYTMRADKIFAEYKSAKKEAEQKYNGRVLLITGELSKIEKPDSLTIAIFVLDEGMFGDEGIRFTLLPNHSSDIHSFVNKEVAIKGYCTGYNDTDIILEKCSFVAL